MVWSEQTTVKALEIMDSVGGELDGIGCDMGQLNAYSLPGPPSGLFAEPCPTISQDAVMNADMNNRWHARRSTSSVE